MGLWAVGSLSLEFGLVHVLVGRKCLGVKSIARCLLSLVCCPQNVYSVCSSPYRILSLIRVLLLNSLQGLLILILRFGIFQTNSNDNLRLKNSVAFIQRLTRVLLDQNGCTCDLVKSLQCLKYPIVG